MTQICPYCSKFHSLHSAEVFCSEYESKGQDLSNNLFYLADGQVSSKEHVSRYTFRYSFEGYQHFTIDGYHRTISPNSVLFLENGQSFTTDTLKGSNVKLMTVAFNPEFFLGTLELASNTHEELLRNPLTELSHPSNSIIQLTSDSLRSLFHDFREVVTQSNYDNNYLEDRFEALIVGLLRIKQKENSTALQSIDVVKVSTKNELFRRLTIGKDYLLSFIQQPINLNDICREIGMSKYHFIRTFNSVYGSTPSQFLKQSRMYFAMDLLKYTSLSILEIASQSGYESPSAFSRAFRQHTNLSPIQYRK